MTALKISSNLMENKSMIKLNNLLKNKKRLISPYKKMIVLKTSKSPPQIKIPKRMFRIIPNQLHKKRGRMGKAMTGFITLNKLNLMGRRRSRNQWTKMASKINI